MFKNDVIFLQIMRIWRKCYNNVVDDYASKLLRKKGYRCKSYISRETVFLCL